MELSQLRGAIENTDPVRGGNRAQYPPEYDGPIGEDQRNQMIHEANLERSFDVVKDDFDAVADGFVNWLATRSDADVVETIGLETPPYRYRKTSDVPGATHARPLHAIAMDQVGHWREHLDGLRAFVDAET